jgi:hypothetical protein
MYGQLTGPGGLLRLEVPSRESVPPIRSSGRPFHDENPPKPELDLEGMSGACVDEPQFLAPIWPEVCVEVKLWPCRLPAVVDGPEERGSRCEASETGTDLDDDIERQGSRSVMRYVRITCSTIVLMSRPSRAARALSSRRRASGTRTVICVYASSDRFPVFARLRRFTSGTPQDATPEDVSESPRHSRVLDGLTYGQIKVIMGPSGESPEHQSGAARKPWQELRATQRVGTP